MLNKDLITCVFADAKASGKVEEMGHEIVNGEEIEVYSVTSLILNPMMTPVILKRRISDGEWISMENEHEKEYYYYIYLYNNEDITLYRGELDEEGEKDRDTEEEVLHWRYSDIGVNPIPETDDEREEGWKKIDECIEEALGFLPDYEI